MSEVDMNRLDLPDDPVLQHGTPVLENRDPIWSEESGQQIIYAVGNKLIVVNT